MLTGIKEVVLTRWESPSPAMVKRSTGTMYLNEPVFSKLDKETKLYVMLHEAGHATLNTKDELAADKFASDAYFSLGYSPKKSVYALTKVLNFSNPEHYKRAELQLERAQKQDNTMNTINRIFDQEGLLETEGYADFLGINITKKQKERAAAKKAAKQEAKLERIQARGANRAAGGGILNGIANVAGSILGGGGTQAPATTVIAAAPEPDDDQEASGSKKWIWIVVAIIVIIIAVVIWKMKKGK